VWVLCVGALQKIVLVRVSVLWNLKWQGPCYVHILLHRIMYHKERGTKCSPKRGCKLGLYLLEKGIHCGQSLRVRFLLGSGLEQGNTYTLEQPLTTKPPAHGTITNLLFAGRQLLSRSG
jgi:hypothetical protein